MKTAILLLPLISRKGKTKPRRHHKGMPPSIPPDVTKSPGKIKLLKRMEKNMIESWTRLSLFAIQKMMIKRTRLQNDRIWVKIFWCITRDKKQANDTPSIPTRRIILRRRCCISYCSPKRRLKNLLSFSISVNYTLLMRFYKIIFIPYNNYL